MATNMKLTVTSRKDLEDGQAQIGFNADYADGANKEWSKYTPAASLTATVLTSIAESQGWEVGKKVTLTIE